MALQFQFRQRDDEDAMMAAKEEASRFQLEAVLFLLSYARHACSALFGLLPWLLQGKTMSESLGLADISFLYVWASHLSSYGSKDLELRYTVSPS